MNYTINGIELCVGGSSYELLESNDKNIIKGNKYLRENNLALARVYYERALDISISWYNLALVHMIRQDFTNMIKYYLWAIEEKNASAMNNLGYYYKQQGDYVAMVKYFTMSAENNNSVAMFNLGTHYRQQHDWANMFKYYLLAVDHGSSHAMNNLGYYYEESQDKDNALKYYLLGVEHGNSTAMNNLANFYNKMSDWDNMIKYYLLAIDQGNAHAMYNLGWYYEQIQNYDAMVKYYLLAIEHNNPNAIVKLKHFYQNQKCYETSIAYHATNINNNNSQKNPDIGVGIKLGEHLNFCAQKICTIDVLLKYRKYLNISSIKVLNRLFVTKMLYNGACNSNCECECECDICYETNTIITLSCNHKLCYKCFDTINTKIPICPYCRRIMQLSDEAYLVPDQLMFARTHAHAPALPHI